MACAPGSNSTGKLYERPARFDFAQVLVEGSEAAQRRQAEQLLEKLRGGLAPETLGERYREYHNRTRANVAAMYGAEFAGALSEAVRGGSSSRRAGFI